MVSICSESDSSLHPNNIVLFMEVLPLSDFSWFSNNLTRRSLIWLSVKINAYVEEARILRTIMVVSFFCAAGTLYKLSRRKKSETA